MSDPSQQPADHKGIANDRPSQGPNLILIYSLLAVALIAAIAVAALIVLPFYHRH